MKENWKQKQLKVNFKEPWLSPHSLFLFICCLFALHVMRHITRCCSLLLLLPLHLTLFHSVRLICRHCHPLFLLVCLPLFLLLLPLRLFFCFFCPQLPSGLQKCPLGQDGFIVALMEQT